MSSNREIHLASRPQGWPTADNFRLVETGVPTPGPGQIVVRNQFISVDPYMRGRMNDVKSYVPPFALDAPLDGGAVGEVVAGGGDGMSVGDTVLHGLGWREYALLDAGSARRVDPDLAPVTAYLGVLGMTGLTAYAGLLDVAAMRPGRRCSSPARPARWAAWSARSPSCGAPAGWSAAPARRPRWPG